MDIKCVHNGPKIDPDIFGIPEVIYDAWALEFKALRPFMDCFINVKGLAAFRYLYF